MENPAESIAHGRFLAIDHHQRWGYPLASYMLEHATFPVPPVILDNQDDHLSLNPAAHMPLPAAILLVEGHRRFNIANYLAHEGRLRQSVPVWLMERARS